MTVTPPEQAVGVVDPTETAVQAHLAAHHGLITRAEAGRLGLSRDQIDWRVRSGRWRVVHRGVYAITGPVPGHHARLLAAVLGAGAGAAASHRSASWLWGWQHTPPVRPQVTVPHGSHRCIYEADLHRRRASGRRSVLVAGIPTTDPLQTLVDLAAAGLPAKTLDDLVDVAIARRQVKAVQLAAAVTRVSGAGRAGPAELRQVLQRRGLVEAPHPSVLESRVMRLLHAWGITPLGVEVAWGGGRYRLDILLAPGVALEVDGFAFHSSPRARSRDLERRNRIRASGIYLVEADWVAVTYEAERVHREIRAALGRQPERGVD